MDPEVGAWYGSMLAYLGRDPGEKYFRALAHQKIQWRRGHSLLAQLMTAAISSRRTPWRMPATFACFSLLSRSFAHSRRRGV